MGNLDEIKVALDILFNKEAEIFLSLILKDSKTLLDGNCLFDVIKIIRSRKVNTLLNNCNSLDTKFEELQTIQDEWEDLGEYILTSESQIMIIFT